jgi:hypothetical protein
MKADASIREQEVCSARVKTPEMVHIALIGQSSWREHESSGDLAAWAWDKMWHA